MSEPTTEQGGAPGEKKVEETAVVGSKRPIESREDAPSGKKPRGRPKAIDKADHLLLWPYNLSDESEELTTVDRQTFYKRFVYSLKRPIRGKDLPEKRYIVPGNIVCVWSCGDAPYIVLGLYSSGKTVVHKFVDE